MKRLFGAIVLANLGLALFGVVKSPSPSTADTRETNASAVKLIPNTPLPTSPASPSTNTLLAGTPESSVLGKPVEAAKLDNGKPVEKPILAEPMPEKPVEKPVDKLAEKAAPAKTAPIKVEAIGVTQPALPVLPAIPPRGKPAGEAPIANKSAPLVPPLPVLEPIKVAAKPEPRPEPGKVAAPAPVKVEKEHKADKPEKPDKADKKIEKPAAEPKPSKPAAEDPRKLLADKPVEKAGRCFQWTGLDAEAMARAKPLTSKVGIAGKMHETAPEARTGGKFWVYLPPKANREEASKASQAAKDKGFDNYIVNTAGETQYAVSMGLFTQEDGAKGLQKRLREAGLEAKLAPRGGAGGAAGKLRFDGLDDKGAASLTRVAASVAAGTVKPVACKP